jgi:hypothetical protein
MTTRRPHSRSLAVSIIALLIAAAAASAADQDEFKVKRSGPFTFEQKPTVTRDGDDLTIAFETTAFCDVTVVIEDLSATIAGSPRIVRHLASGVLGPNPPAPFAKNSRKQSLVWNGKDDQGRYIDEQDTLRVRVSLGLNPQFERTLFWSPKRRQSRMPPLACAAEEGVYVYDGGRQVVCRDPRSEPPDRARPHSRDPVQR